MIFDKLLWGFVFDVEKIICTSIEDIEEISFDYRNEAAKKSW